jgi:lipid II:glycine glycyltransferase (peptidoglycan interpeptide bridge formation enzyme)
VIRLVAEAYSQKDWTDIVSTFQDLSLLQTWEYAEAKSHTGSWRVERATFWDGNHVVGAVQSLVREIPLFGGGFVWINRGPLWRGQVECDHTVLMTMLSELRRYWVERHGMCLWVAPPLLSNEADIGLFSRNGYRLIEGSEGWASAVVDLSLPVAMLRQRLQQKWRNCLNKAERLALASESGTSGDIFHKVLDDYDRMLRERRYRSSVTRPLLSRLQGFLPEERKLWGVSGRQGDQNLGGLLIARYGQRCEYLVGAVNEAGRAVNAGHFLLWRAINQMKELGYRWFDLGGMSQERTPAGVFHFKSGLGGEPYKLVGEFESFRDNFTNRAIRWWIRHAHQQAN